MALEPVKKTLGGAVDEIIQALEPLDATTRLTAVRAACEHLAIPLTGQSSIPTLSSFATPPSSASVDASSAPLIDSRILDIRTLKQQKNPASAIEMACIVAYYLMYAAPQSEKKPEIAAEDLETYFIQAGYPLPKVPGQVLIDAKASGYFDRLGSGNYKLNAVGHNLVAHALPRTGGSSVTRVKRATTKATRSAKTGSKK